jgi:hypothetical protein
MGLAYSSDTRGSHAFIPVVRAEIVACPQLPTTLPTLGEAPPEKILARTAEARRDQVFTLHAEHDAGFDKLLAGWQTHDLPMVPLRELAAALDVASLPLHSVALGGQATQGPAFLAE